MVPRRIGILAFEGCTALDLVGPAEAFAAAQVPADGGRDPRPGYEIILVGLTTRPVRAESGVILKPHVSLRTAPRLDTIIVPGGHGLREPAVLPVVAAWLRRRAASTRRIASVCTGVYGLAATGLLDGRTVTTHWRFVRDVARRFPRLRVDPDAIFLRDGPFCTSAGVTAGIDLSLALIEEDYGPRVALATAREMVVYLKRPGGQEQFSEPLRFQTSAGDRLADVAAWVTGHLDRDLSVAALAARACLCTRQFTRRFSAAFGVPPAAFVRNQRLDEARRRLSVVNQTVDTVAHSVGFGSADAFRRAFQERFGVAPTAYRKAFPSPRQHRRAGRRARKR